MILPRCPRVPQRLNIFDFSRGHRPLRNASVDCGAYLAPGLPELYGSVFIPVTTTHTLEPRADGAFSVERSGGSSVTFSEGAGDIMFLFKASQFNNIYGKSTSVTPPASNTNIAIYLGRVSEV